MELIRKARKKHECDSCEEKILKGERYKETRLRLPRFGEDNETQIGVEYLSFKTCETCIELIKKEQVEWDAITQTEEYKYQENMWEHRYP